MATAQTVPVQDNGVGSLLAQIFQQSGNLFGSGKTTTQEQTAPLDLTNSNTVLAQILQGTDPKSIDDMINGILTKAKDAFGPNISNSLAAGNRALTDTTLATIQGKAQGTATAEAAKAKLEAISRNNQIAATIVDSQVQGQARVAAQNTTKTTQTAASPAGKGIQALGVAATGYSIYDKLTKKKTPPPGSASVADNIFSSSGGISPTAANTSGAVGGDVATGGIAGPAGDLGQIGVASSDVSNTLSATDGVVNSVFAGDAAASDALFGAGAFASDAVAADTAGAIGGDTLTGGIAGAAGDLGQIGTEAASGGGDISGGVLNMFGDIPSIPSPLDIIGGADIPVVSDLANVVNDVPFASDIIDLASGGKVICTELLRQKLIPPHLYTADLAISKVFIHPVVSLGYRTWAIPYVNLMRKSKLATNFIRPFAIAWANQVCYDYCNPWNRSKYSPTLFGKILRKVGEPICYLIGKLMNLAPRKAYGR